MRCGRSAAATSAAPPTRIASHPATAAHPSPRAAVNKPRPHTRLKTTTPGQRLRAFPIQLRHAISPEAIPRASTTANAIASTINNAATNESDEARKSRSRARSSTSRIETRTKSSSAVAAPVTATLLARFMVEAARFHH